jgi:hypothetical protein
MKYDFLSFILSICFLQSANRRIAFGQAVINTCRVKFYYNLKNIKIADHLSEEIHRSASVRKQEKDG